MNKFFPLAILTFFLTVAANAQSPESQSLDGNQPIFRQLGLSSEQLSRIREINQRQRQKLQQATVAVERARIALDDAIYSDEASEEKLRDALARFNRAQSELASVRMQTEFEIRKVLTPEQLSQFRQMRQSRRGPGRMGPGPRPGRGAPMRRP